MNATDDFADYGDVVVGAVSQVRKRDFPGSRRPPDRPERGGGVDWGDHRVEPLRLQLPLQLDQMLNVAQEPDLNRFETSLNRIKEETVS